MGSDDFLGTDAQPRRISKRKYLTCTALPMRASHDPNPLILNRCYSAVKRDGNMRPDICELSGRTRIIGTDRSITVLQVGDTCCVKYKRAEEDIARGDSDRSRPQSKSSLLCFCLSRYLLRYLPK
jgi:hypothetical protein